MVQFGVHMHFLHIKQVSAIKYILEIYFLISFPDFPNSLDWATIAENSRGYGVNVSKTQGNTRVDRGLLI
jgi:hypothetical protein